MTQTVVSPPWWRVPVMWLVIGGPALAVVAGTATLVLALRISDAPLHDAVGVRSVPMTPATQARNHAVAARP